MNTGCAQLERDTLDNKMVRIRENKESRQINTLRYKEEYFSNPFTASCLAHLLLSFTHQKKRRKKFVFVVWLFVCVHQMCLISHQNGIGFAVNKRTAKSILIALGLTAWFYDAMCECVCAYCVFNACASLPCL